MDSLCEVGPASEDGSRLGLLTGKGITELGDRNNAAKMQTGRSKLEQGSPERVWQTSLGQGHKESGMRGVSSCSISPQQWARKRMAGKLPETFGKKVRPNKSRYTL